MIQTNAKNAAEKHMPALPHFQHFAIKTFFDGEFVGDNIICDNAVLA